MSEAGWSSLWARALASCEPAHAEDLRLVIDLFYLSSPGGHVNSWEHVLTLPCSTWHLIFSIVSPIFGSPTQGAPDLPGWGRQDPTQQHLELSWKIKSPFLCYSLRTNFSSPSLLRVKEKNRTTCTVVFFWNIPELDIKDGQQLGGFPDPVAGWTLSEPAGHGL